MFSINALYTPNKSYKEQIEPHFNKKISAQLIQVFTHKCDKDFIQQLLEELNEFMPNAIIIGSTTDGEIMGSSVYTGTTVLSFTFFEKSELRAYSVSYIDDSVQSFTKGTELASSFVKDNTKAVISFADGLNTNADEFLQGFASVNPDTVIAGGLAGDNATFSGTYVFTHEGIVEKGVAAVAIDSEALNVVTDYGFGWIPIGKEMRVSKSEKNHVFTIDDQPAAEVYNRYLGEEAGKQLPVIGIEFPLIIQEYGHNVARAVLARMEDDSLIFAGNIPEGSRVYFGVGEVNEILSESQHLLHSMSKYPLESIFAYSCMARRRFLNKNASLEFESLSQIAPISGFCAYGEFFHHEQKNYLFNQSTTMIGLWENDSRYTPNRSEKKIKDPKEYSLGTLKALTHLINVVTRELADANKELEEKSRIMLIQSRLSAMGEMVGNIAHQWRQPLNSLGLIIQDVEDAYDFGELDQTYIENMVQKSMEQINYMSKTIDDFRAFIQPNQEQELFDLYKIVSESVYLASSSLTKHGVECVVKEPANGFKILGYGNELKQVIVNLLNNAKDAIKEKGIENGKIEISFSQERQSVKVTVCDNAGGIPEDIIDRIFEPYFTTKGNLNGSGLGLYMSKTIVEQRMHGVITVQNRDEGACFILKLPIHTAANAGDTQ